jgi:hypothetical protein
MVTGPAAPPIDPQVAADRHITQALEALANE